MLQIGRKRFCPKSRFHLNCQRENIKCYKKKKHSDSCLDWAAATPCESLSLISTSHSEVTHPWLRLLLLGSIFRSLGQRHDEERERIFARPPLPWHESRGTTGVKTPDNQSGILNSHKVKARAESDSPVGRKTTHSFLVNNRACNESTTVRGTAAEVESTFPTDRHKAAAARLPVRGVKQIWAKQ